MQRIDFTYNNSVADFLTNPKKRICRHLLLIVCFAIVAVNVSLLTYPNHHNIALINSLGLLIVYLGIVYLNLYVLVPRYLLQNRYWTYIGLLLALVILLASTELAVEFYIKTHFHIEFGKYSALGQGHAFLFDILTTCFLYTICFAGTSITVFFKHWLTSGQHMNELEKETIKTEFKRLKNQVHPDFLFHTLEKAGALATQSPSKTSDILMKLSKFLRCQLYDSSRSKVMLSSEIASLKNLLNLEKEQLSGFTYSIIIEGDIKRVLVPPLLFISLVLQVISNIEKDNIHPFINLSFCIKEELLEFTCSSTKSNKLTNISNIN